MSVAAAAQGQGGQGGPPTSGTQQNQLIVSRVEVDYAPIEPKTVSALRIYGSNFGTGLPTVTLDGTPLSVVSNTGTRIDAVPTPARAFGAGSYLLKVAAGASQAQATTFDLTVGSEGAKGDKGDTGPAPSTDNFVTVDGAQTVTGAKTFTQTVNGSISGNAATADSANALAPTATVSGSQVVGPVNLADKAATVSVPLNLSNSGQVLSLNNNQQGSLTMLSEARTHNTYGIRSEAGGVALTGVSVGDNDGPVHSVGVHGETQGAGGAGVRGEARVHNATGVSGVGGAYGVYGESVGDNDGPEQSTGVYGYANVFNGTGVRGRAAHQNSGTGVSGFGTIGVYGQSEGSSSNGNNVGVYAIAGANGTAVRATNTAGGTAGLFEGNVTVTGNLTVSGTTAATVTHANTAGTANALSGSATVPAAQVAGALTAATVGGDRITGNLSIAGNGTFSGSLSSQALSAPTVTAGTQFNIGSQRVLSMAGGFNFFAGPGAAESITTGSGNAFFGDRAGRATTEGRDNAFFGSAAGVANTSGGFNTSVGASTGASTTTGSANTFAGARAGVGNTTGGGNTALGYNAGLSNTIESNNTFIGAWANGAAGITNATAVGYGATATQSNSLVLGNDASVGVGTSAPKAKLHVSGGKVYVEANGQGVILKSPNGTCYEMTVNDDGALTTAPVACP